MAAAQAKRHLRVVAVVMVVVVVVAVACMWGGGNLGFVRLEIRAARLGFGERDGEIACWRQSDSAKPTADSL